MNTVNVPCAHLRSERPDAGRLTEDGRLAGAWRRNGVRGVDFWREGWSVSRRRSRMGARARAGRASGAGMNLGDQSGLRLGRLIGIVEDALDDARSVADDLPETLRELDRLFSGSHVDEGPADDRLLGLGERAVSDRELPVPVLDAGGPGIE